MKIVYKIYHSHLSKEVGMAYAHVTPARTPDFDTEAEAEKHLEEILSKQEDGDFLKQNYSYYCIQKTYMKK